jgi:hypothetical protein
MKMTTEFGSNRPLDMDKLLAVQSVLASEFTILPRPVASLIEYIGISFISKGVQAVDVKIVIRQNQSARICATLEKVEGGMRVSWNSDGEINKAHLIETFKKEIFDLISSLVKGFEEDGRGLKETLNRLRLFGRK